MGQRITLYKRQIRLNNTKLSTDFDICHNEQVTHCSSSEREEDSRTRLGTSSWLILRNKTRSTGESTPLLLGLRIHAARVGRCPGGFLRSLPPTFFNVGLAPCLLPAAPPGEPTPPHAEGLAQPRPPRLVRPRAPPPRNPGRSGHTPVAPSSPGLRPTPHKRWASPPSTAPATSRAG